VSEAASHLLRASGKDSTETLLGACDWLIARKRPDLALPLWNGLATRISYPSLGADSPITNGEFTKSPHFPRLRLAPRNGGRGKLLSKRQSERAGLRIFGRGAGQFYPAEPDSSRAAQKDYALTIDYGTSGIPPGSGIEWLVTDERTGAELAKTASLSAEQGGTAKACFTAPEGAAFVKSVAALPAATGHGASGGKLALKGVRLSAATAGDCAAEKISNSRADSPAL